MKHFLKFSVVINTKIACVIYHLFDFCFAIYIKSATTNIYNSCYTIFRSFICFRCAKFYLSINIDCSRVENISTNSGIKGITTHISVKIQYAIIYIYKQLKYRVAFKIHYAVI